MEQRLGFGEIDRIEPEVDGQQHVPQSLLLGIHCWLNPPLAVCQPVL